jgi:hypothetical protein
MVACATIVIASAAARRILRVFAGGGDHALPQRGLLANKNLLVPEVSWQLIYRDVAE